jgi:hypothetical protein
MCFFLYVHLKTNNAFGELTWLCHDLNIYLICFLNCAWWLMTSIRVSNLTMSQCLAAHIK